MIHKRIAIAIVMLVLLVPLAANVSASGGRPQFTLSGGRNLAHSSVIQEATSLDADEIVSALQEGSSIALLIEANNTDIDAVIADLIEEATAQINESKDAAISQLPDAISQQLGRRWHWGFRGNAPVFASIFRKGDFNKPTMESDTDEAPETTAEGASLMALFEANGGDVDGLVTDLVAEATTQINEFASARIESLEDSFGEQLNATYTEQGRRRLRFIRPRLPLPNTP